MPLSGSQPLSVLTPETAGPRSRADISDSMAPAPTSPSAIERICELERIQSCHSNDISIILKALKHLDSRVCRVEVQLGIDPQPIPDI